MVIQLTTNSLGTQNLYFGHPYSKETYTNSVMLKTPIQSWEANLDGIYSGNDIKFEPESSYDSISEIETEYRVIRGTKVMFIGDYNKVLEMENDPSVYNLIKNNALIKVNNPDYMEFDAYTKKVLNDPLKNINDIKTITPYQAKKYMDYAVRYDKDKKFSDKLIMKPYFMSFENGCLILTEDFVDYNITLQVSPEDGVVGITVKQSKNTSKYIDQYKEI